jgi:hypothetical protein
MNKESNESKKQKITKQISETQPKNPQTSPFLLTQPPPPPPPTKKKGKKEEGKQQKPSQPDKTQPSSKTKAN